MQSQTKSYTVMSFNILGWIPASGAENRHNKLMRVGLMDKLVNLVNPDSFGLQECTDRWMNLLSPMWEDKYIWVGERNEDSQRIYNPVFYRKDKFRCIATRTLWLSDTPEVWCSGFERHPDDQSRMVTYAVLENKQSGEIFAHFNTHLGIDRAAMQKQLAVLKGITDKCPYPFVLTGDFNVNMDWKERDTMKEFWSEGREVAKITSDVPSIDYCMLSKLGIDAEEFCVLTEPFAIKREWESGNTKGQPYYISDHYPVYIRFSLK